ncbi:MAG TPA: HPr family phosphocarrier protein [Gammaproteobacteria bacterium]|jgi:phosphocarrier protein|nr:HPr family phosphocarrier protein [Gammaproteobacteria bacterium]
MIKEPVTIQNQLGLHTRAAAKLVDTAKKYASKIELTYRNRTVDCKSIMGVITLGAVKNSVVDVIIDGDDEQNALEAIRKLIDAKFGED